MRRCWSGGRLTSPEFPMGADYILSYIELAKLSFVTDNHLVSEPFPCPAFRLSPDGFRNLAADCPDLYRFYHTRGHYPVQIPFSGVSLVDRTLGVSRNLIILLWGALASQN